MILKSTVNEEKERGEVLFIGGNGLSHYGPPKPITVIEKQRPEIYYFNKRQKLLKVVNKLIFSLFHLKKKPGGFLCTSAEIVPYSEIREGTE